MARINLLPWRAEQRQRKNKEFLTLVAMITILAIGAALATLFFFNNELKEQQNANQLITAENQKLDIALKEIEDLEQRREEMISRMKVIQDLQGRRPIPVRVWDELINAIPDALYLTELERSGDTLTLKGKASNPNVVSSLITNMDDSEWMGGSALRNIIEKNKSRTNSEGTKEVLYPEDEFVAFEVTTQIEINKNDSEDENTSNENGGDEQ